MPTEQVELAKDDAERQAQLRALLDAAIAGGISERSFDDFRPML